MLWTMPINAHLHSAARKKMLPEHIYTALLGSTTTFHAKWFFTLLSKALLTEGWKKREKPSLVCEENNHEVKTKNTTQDCSFLFCLSLKIKCIAANSLTHPSLTRLIRPTFTRPTCARLPRADSVSLLHLSQSLQISAGATLETPFWHIFPANAQVQGGFFITCWQLPLNTVASTSQQNTES